MRCSCKITCLTQLSDQHTASYLRSASPQPSIGRSNTAAHPPPQPPPLLTQPSSTKKPVSQPEQQQRQATNRNPHTATKQMHQADTQCINSRMDILRSSKPCPRTNTFSKHIPHLNPCRRSLYLPSSLNIWVACHRNRLAIPHLQGCQRCIRLPTVVPQWRLENIVSPVMYGNEMKGMES